MRSFRFRILILVLLLLLGAGCSISDSISSPFESSYKSSRSSSGSSSSDRGAAYREEVRDYTTAYVKSTQDLSSFQRGLSGIAERHGVSDWESDMDTYVGIGQGLRKAGVKPSDFAVWKTNLAGTDGGKASAMQKGYDSGS